MRDTPRRPLASNRCSITLVHRTEDGVAAHGLRRLLAVNVTGAA